MSASLLTLHPEGYKECLKEVKERIRSAHNRGGRACS